MSIISTLIILIIIFSIWDWLKRKVSHSATSNYYEHGVHYIQVTCPHCHSALTIPGEGIWNCSECRRPFEYKSGHTYKCKPVLSPAITLIVELYAKFAKADGVVTKEEVQSVDSIIKSSLHPTDKELTEIRTIFNLAKGSSNGFQDIVHSLYELFQDNPQALLNIIENLFVISKTNGQLNNQQETILLYTVNAFNLADQYSTIKAKYYSAIDAYYKVLGCEPSDSLETIKHSYRRLVKEYHPDKYASKQLPKDIMDYANRRFQAIQEAYEQIVKYRTAH
ncbi:hypothetical protein GCM10011391_06650 [Pullulanibacillus camelliae]|uniref:J domain-containing protein n=1 Tax=Pullulanibacillus camelliae TaxID=1707096 RepID=A0A8J2VL58_9BACL|nr:TerB family tellurite resistance protein [Pullulanibacillus camelliae]GGE30657.1 hypothetical protein GCM10011391_06650 [Pullulanibacillus camelliae]